MSKTKATVDSHRHAQRPPIVGAAGKETELDHLHGICFWLNYLSQLRTKNADDRVIIDLVGSKIPATWQFAEKMASEAVTAWTHAEEIVSAAIGLLGSESLLQAAERFNLWAQQNRVQLEIPRLFLPLGGRKYMEPIFVPAVRIERYDYTTHALWMVWRLFDYDWRRLKRCPECKSWFADNTKGRVKSRCSRACTNKYWTRERRREAGHDVPGSTRKTKRRATR